MAETTPPPRRDALQHFDFRRNGPLLGISDSGEAAAEIIGAGMNSARTAAGGLAVNGLILDLERMGSSGETPVGPPEYAMLHALVPDLSFASTNVGVRTNARIYQPYPQVPVAPSDDAGEVTGKLLAEFAAYQTPRAGGPARPLQVRLLLDGTVPDSQLADIAGRFEAARGTAVSGPDIHVLAALKTFDHPLGPGDSDAILALLRTCKGAGIAELAIDAPWREEAKLRGGVQGLLNIVPAATINALLDAANAAGVRLSYRLSYDVECVTRTIWQGLASARAEGLHAAKYGLTPLTFEEQRRVIHTVQGWFPDWTAVPAFYADTPLVTASHVYFSDEIEAAAQLWLDMVAAEGIKLVLFDCPDRYLPRADVSSTRLARRMVRVDGDAGGALTLDEIGRLRDHADALGIGILWSGGIQPNQAFPLGKLGVAGIFTTGSTAVPAPVGPTLQSDPRLPFQPVPTELGVRRVHSLLLAGFLARQQHDAIDRDALEAARAAVERAEANSPALAEAIEALDELVITGLEALWA